ncbi:RNA helicase [Acetobacter estunensis NRIC 0472]|uniref:DEAD-box ATP-dependent RNA helicase RhpA n=1 Tax=Acetobacter estunensis TaxID=104097 RepID=A0A967B5Z1_9PROT|nr:DEAD/DEAH box helicase [Acetobacter estunensis]NHO53849.1 DEAD/DEAH box helicase [Acetobacter estunensis]GBQ24562.1 RNA helicase [Acetobacter estunensis NRIC 0472]
MSPKATDTTERKPRKAAARPRARKAATAEAPVPDETTEVPAVQTEAPQAETGKPARRTTRRKTSAAVKTPAVEIEETPAKPAPKTTRTRKKVAKPEVATEVETPTATEEEVKAPVKKRTPRRKAATTAVAEAAPAAESADAPEAAEDTPKKTPRKRATSTTTRKPRAKKATKVEATEETTPTAETVEPQTPAEDEEHHPLHITGALEVTTEPAPQSHKSVIVEAAPVVAAPVAKAEDAEPLFSDLGLSAPLLQAVQEMGYVHPTPIQAQAIPAVLRGQDVLGVAQTGTGKTASFTLPLLEILSGSRARARMPRSLILEPTRELALQVAENFVNYGKHLKLTHALLIGGESMADQKEVLNRGVDVLIATPGRLIDLFERGGLLLTQTRILVIDEADRMLDMGFIPDIERIVGLLPRTRQTLFFSATMAPEIRRLADAFLQSPREITVSRPSTVATTIEAGLVVVDDGDKRKTLRRMLRAENLQNAIIFCNRKRDVDVLLKSLLKHGFSAGALHGDLPQSVRFQTLEKFKSGELKILVCSDVAARGIDIGGLSHVFNFDLPFHAEDYVHRIGRTGRAGKQGKAYSLATPHDRKFAEAIEALTGAPIPRLKLEGVEQLDWAAEDDDTGGRGRNKRKRRSNADKKSETDAQPAARKTEEREARPVKPREETQAPAREERRAPPRKRDDRRNNNGSSDIPDAPAESVTGFGADMPHFMTLPRRVPVKIEDMGEDAAEA